MLMRSLLYRRVPTRTGVSEGLRAPIRPLMETIAVLRQASFQPTSSVAERSAFGDGFFFGIFCLLTRMRQSWNFCRIAHIAL